MADNTNSKLRDTTKKLGERAKQVIVQDAKDVGSLASQAVSSGTYIYPIRGIYYFLSHPSLYRPVQQQLISSAILSLIVLVVFFVFLYPPQALFLALFSGPLGFIGAVPLVLGEAYVVILGLGRKVLVAGEGLEDIFDAVLIKQGHEDLVSRVRESAPDRKSPFQSLGRSVLKSRLSALSFSSLVRYVISLPLNAIPGVGTFLFVLYNGRREGPGFHERYFALKGWGKKEREEWVAKNQGAYTSFGATAAGLNLVPFASLLFAFTNTVGAALWASDIEKKLRKGQDPSGEQQTSVEAGTSTSVQKAGNEL